MLTATTESRDYPKGIIPVKEPESSCNAENLKAALAEDFVPSDNDVICGRARENFHHGMYIAHPETKLCAAIIGVLKNCPTELVYICGYEEGNRRFRLVIEKSIGPYLAAETKLEKSEAISRVVDHIQVLSPRGGFVMQDSATGRWFRIREAKARDK